MISYVETAGVATLAAFNMWLPMAVRRILARAVLMSVVVATEVHMEVQPRPHGTMRVGRTTTPTAPHATPAMLLSPVVRRSRRMQPLTCSASTVRNLSLASCVGSQGMWLAIALICCNSRGSSSRGSSGMAIMQRVVASITTSRLHPLRGTNLVHMWGLPRMQVTLLQVQGMHLEAALQRMGTQRAWVDNRLHVLHRSHAESTIHGLAMTTATCGQGVMLP